MYKFTVLIIILCFTTLHAEEATVKYFSEKIDTPEQAKKRALLITGFDKLEDFDAAKNMIEPKRTNLVDSTTPFIGDQLNKNNVWEVVFKDIYLHLRQIPLQT